MSLTEKISTPLFSIVIPTFNRKDYVSQAIESALSMRHSNFEVLIIDNASTDGTYELALQYKSYDRVRVVRNEVNIGPYGSFRKALHEEIRTPWFVILSDDDFYTDLFFLSKVEALIARYPSTVLFHANCDLLFSDGRLVNLKKIQPEFVSGKWMFENYGKEGINFTGLLTTVVKTEAARNLRFFEQSYLGCDWFDFFRLCLHGNVGFVSESVGVWRQHTSNVTRSTSLDIWFENIKCYTDAYAYARKLNIFDGRSLKNWLDRNCLNYFAWVFERLYVSRDRDAFFNLIARLTRYNWTYLRVFFRIRVFVKALFLLFNFERV